MRRVVAARRGQDGGRRTIGVRRRGPHGHAADGAGSAGLAAATGRPTSGSRPESAAGPSSDRLTSYLPSTPAADPSRFGAGSSNSAVHFSGSASPLFHTFARTTAVFSLCSTANLAVYQTPGCQSNTATLLIRPAGGRLPVAGTLAWAAVLVAGCLWELGALLQQPSLTTDSYSHPTVSTLTDPVLANSPGRAVVLLGWLALGWYLVER